MFYLNSFLIFSILGWCYEMTFHCLEGKIRQNILFGPWMPIYGFGILLVELIYQSLKKLKINGKKRLVYTFLLSVFLLTCLEEIGGLLIEIIFHTSFWNYESLPLSIGPYINIFISLLWGILGLIFIYIIEPILTPWIKKIPKSVSIILFLLFLLDNIISIFLKSNIGFFNKSFTFMWFIS